MSGGDVNRQAEAVLNIIAPYIDGPLGIAPVRWPLLAFHDNGRAILPDDIQLRHLAGQIAAAIQDSSRQRVMTAADEAAVALARDEAAVTLARETAAQRGEVGVLTGAVAEWADWALAGGVPPKEVAHRMIKAGRLIAAAARGQAVTR